MAKKGGARRKPGTGAKLALGIVTFLNLLLTLLLSLERRQSVLRAVNQDGAVKLLLEEGKKKE
ncbi:hypothetical protein D7X94_03485 [Acutalibacter sp. 1XD8-33]|uniref:hypothetical protein n=1 Tax=Acutalibacter sp. 1XD8-33 TaxID=2320081 RepID=UPI000EA33A11|nr:hypothetical protein [Acutalibacter sp. 1XD8-33]RKJ41365.1 hypothetical protein D7X94_03485 [Acutalibacter sp. 1XD8-33]